MVHDEEIDKAFIGNEFQAELLLEGLGKGRRGLIRVELASRRRVL